MTRGDGLSLKKVARPTAGMAEVPVEVATAGAAPEVGFGITRFAAVSLVGAAAVMTTMSSIF